MSTLEQLEEEVALLLSGEEISEEVVNKLIEVGEKRDAFGVYINDLIDRALAIRNRVAEMERRARRFENKAQGLKRLAAMIMHRHGTKKLEGTEITMTLLEGSDHVVIDDERQVPDQFKETKTVVIKAAVGDALREGSAVPGAHLETGPDTIRVYR